MVSFPRFVRPHTVILKHKTGEEDFDAIYEETTIKYVKFDESYGITQSQRGIDSKDDTLCIIDLNDLHATKKGKRCQYINYHNYVHQDNLFSIFKDDLIVFNGREYTITSINEMNPFENQPEFIEVRANGF